MHTQPILPFEELDDEIPRIEIPDCCLEELLEQLARLVARAANNGSRAQEKELRNANVID